MIRRQNYIEGLNLPVVIHNSQYFYTNLSVYKDGMISCWELVDNAGFKVKLKSGWISQSIPEGKALSVHGLGSFTVANGNWYHNQKSYYKLVMKKIKSLNPQLANIYKYSKQDIKLMEERRFKVRGAGEEYSYDGKFGYRTLDGKGFYIIMNNGESYRLMNLVVYKDGNVICYDSSCEYKYHLESIEDYFKNGTFIADIPRGERLLISDFGDFEVKSQMYSVDMVEKYKELVNNHSILNEEETPQEKCRKAYYNYLEYPTDYNRNVLKELYEAIPEHQRLYLGDMDSKDSDYRRIIYTPHIKREV